MAADGWASSPVAVAAMAAAFRFGRDERGAHLLFLMIMAVMVAGLLPARIGLAGEASLPALLRETRFIAYTPRSFSLVAGKVLPASASGIREDLSLLRPMFDGLITYATANGLEAVPAIAREMGFRAVVLGIWDPLSAVELQNVVQAARRYPSLVAAVVIGNEGIYTGRYQPRDVQQAVRLLKRECPALAVTTSEPFFLYFKKEYAEFFSAFDLLMPNVHPIFESWFKASEPTAGVVMVLDVVRRLKAAYRLPLLLKETGVPSGPATGQAGFTPERQAQFWAELIARFPAAADQALSCFEAFDAPWKPAAIGDEFPGDHATEAYWGFFTAGGAAKPVVKVLPQLKNRHR